MMTLLICTVAGIGAGAVYFSRKDTTPSPYWAVAGTNPNRWLWPEREVLSWRMADMDDCHAEANFFNSKKYLTWEEKVNFFGNCMKGKGYRFDSPLPTKRGMLLNGVTVAPDGDGITEQAAMLLPDNDGKLKH
jgi:hypothetical protein